MRNFISAALAAGMLGLCPPAWAQTIPGDVTFEVPLNLTRLDSRITQIDITCYITSDAIPAVDNRMGGENRNRLVGEVTLPVTLGRLVTTANVVVPVAAGRLVDPIGKSANYECMITAYSAGTRSRTGGTPAGWGFLEENSANPAFRFSPTPQPITGSFDW